MIKGILRRTFSTALNPLETAKPIHFNKLRSHLLGEINETHLQKEVSLCGWVSAIRNVSKNVFFLVLRDHSGSIQLTATRTHIPENTFLALQEAVTSRKITPEAVVSIKGIVQPRPIGMDNQEMSSGSIEIFINDYEILNTVETKLPFTLNEKYLPTEDVRLTDRVLDLRRNEMQQVIRFRSKVNRFIRNYFDSKGFVEIETPILFKSSPEGAKEFLVPRADGLKYALPQSPQQFKQLLMIGGFDKYYQIAKCFRDEGFRADRQPEFTQLDMEMAFVTQDDIMTTMEGVVKSLWSQTAKDLSGFNEHDPFPRITYDDAIKLYGSDKPDTRFDGKIAFSIPSNPSNIVVEGLLLKGKGRNSLNSTGTFEFCLPIEGIHSKEVLKAFEHGSSESISKWHGNRLEECGIINDEELGQINSKLEELGLNVGPRDCLLIQKRDTLANVGITDLGRARLSALSLIQQHQPELVSWNQSKFLWVHSFPLLCRASPDSILENPLRRFDSMHHPFTAPEIQNQNEIFTCKEPLALRAQHYDLVLNGQEIGGGSVRIHNAEIQERLMRDLLGLSSLQIDHFSHLLRALKLGAPPHAGMAIGLDRLIAILAGKQSIRDVIVFPKNSSGFDLCLKAPN